MTDGDSQAIEAWNLLECNGGIDWSGLPLVVGMLGITDIDGLLTRLRTLKTYARKKDES